MPHPSEPSAPTILPTVEDMLSVWRADRCIQDNSAALYLQWVRRFRKYCEQHKLDERAELTLEGARRFIVWYAQQRLLDEGKLGAARNALRALSRVHQVMGLNPPIWQAPQLASAPASALLGEYGDHLARRRGNPAVTVHMKLRHIGKLWEHLSRQGKTWSTMVLTDIDAFLVACAQRYARSTTAGIAGSVRSFTHFLLATGHISIDLADSVIAPVQPKHERPRRALPWEDAASVCSAPWMSPQREAFRDYALLLVMSAYGFGAGEATGLQVQDIDWSASMIKAVRPKTGVAFTLPLLPGVAKALVQPAGNPNPVAAGAHGISGGRAVPESISC